MKALGTILPTAQSLKNSDTIYRREQRQKAAIAKREGLKNGIRVGLETQYPVNGGYAIVTSRMTVAFFDVRTDGVYRRK
jgi:hypothetical protein